MCASMRGATIGTLPFWDYDPNSAKRTPIGGQFAWGRTPLKDIKGAQWLTQVGRKLTEECKSISQPDVIQHSSG